MSNCYQRVTINNSYSDPLPIVSGVPQGSILGPLLFIVYINNMSLYINHSQYLKFADDTKCFLHINTLSDHIALQEDITAIFTWSLDSDMDFNFKKFIHLSFKSKLDTIYTISDTCIPRSDSHKDLGIILSVDLSWDKHYKTITSRAYKLLGLIRRTLSSCHSTTTMTRLYVSLVHSQLFYCTQVWRPHLMRDTYLEYRMSTAPCHQVHTQRLHQLLQNSITESSSPNRLEPTMLLKLPIIL